MKHFWSLFHKKQKRGKKPKLFSIWSHCKTHTFWHPFSRAIATLTSCLPCKIHTKVIRDQMKFLLPLCHLGQAYVRLCSMPMALHQCSDTCSSLPRKPIGRGEGSRERKAVSPFLPHLQCSLWCRNTGVELGSFSFHQSTMCLSRKSIPSPPYHICRQRHRDTPAGQKHD